MGEGEKIRTPAVAGSFYPSGREELMDTIRKLLSSITIPKLGKKLFGVIFPHAGYQFAGIPQAASVSLIPKTTKRLIIFGPSHHFFINKFVVYPEGIWLTPLGEVEIDREFVNLLVWGNTIFTRGFLEHEHEHSIEVIIPFLQCYLGKFKIVPILVSHPPFEIIEKGAKIIKEKIGNADGETIFMASSDLYHGFSYDEGIYMDRKTVEAIIEGDPQKFYELLEKDEIMACGGYAICLLLSTHREFGGGKIELIHYTNSLDVLGTKRGYFVGYSSIALTLNGGNLSG